MQVTDISEKTLSKFVTSKFMDHVKRMAAKGKRKFIEVPPGDSKVHAEFPSHLGPGIPINYRKEAKEQVCLVALFASFLYAMNCQQDAAQLFL